MKNLKKYSILLTVLLIALSACHDLNVPITTQLTPDVFPKTTSQFVAASGQVYAALRGNYATEYFFSQCYTTDEGIMPARGGGWYDGAQNKDMHYHNWTKDNPYVNSNWTWLSTVIGMANQTLSILSANEPEGDYKNTNLAEIRMVKALAYFMLMDSYGNVPIVKTFGDFTQHPTASRTEVFTYIESEIQACLPNLSTTTDITTYGRPTYFAAQALLAKMYLNAQYYIGVERNNDCIVACDAIINSGKFKLASIADYLVMFYPSNGPTSPGSKDEFIFAIPFDATSIGNIGRSTNYKARYDVPRSMGLQPNKQLASPSGYNYFNIQSVPGGPASTLPEFYAYFNDVNDVRNKQWLKGLQFRPDGVTPITITTTKAGYDAITYPGDKTPYTFQLDLTPNIVLRQSVPLFDCGNDEVAWNMGYRNIKFYPDATSLNRNQNNDIPVFRYSDIILMKAEAIQRGGTPTLGHTALSLVNMLRAVRTTSAALGTVTLDDIYAERCREFAWEGWHRNDVIRYGKYEGSWGFKTDSDPNKRIFPIPTNAINVNRALTQNDGY